MNRPTRVPASTVVRMKSASNMMAKWYQSPSARCRTLTEHLRDADGEGGGATGAESRVCSPTDAVSAWKSAGENLNPQPWMTAAADSTDTAERREGRIHGEVGAGIERRGRRHRHDRDE